MPAKCNISNVIQSSFTANCWPASMHSHLDLWRERCQSHEIYIFKVYEQIPSSTHEWLASIHRFPPRSSFQAARSTLILIRRPTSVRSSSGSASDIGCRGLQNSQALWPRCGGGFSMWNIIWEKIDQGIWGTMVLTSLNPLKYPILYNQINRDESWEIWEILMGGPAESQQEGAAALESHEDHSCKNRSTIDG